MLPLGTNQNINILSLKQNIFYFVIPHMRTKLLYFFKIILISFTMLLSKNLFGAELYEYQIPISAQGMGGVYIPFPDAADAPFVNPAYLGLSSDISWNILSLGGGINGMDIYQSASNFRNVSTPSDYNQYFGKRIWLSGAAKTSIVAPYFGIGFYDEFRTAIYLHNPAFPNLNIDFLNDYGLYVSGAISIGSVFATGITLKRINRWGGVNDIGLSTISASSGSQILESFKDKGVGYGMDLAMMAQIPGFFKPSFSVVWKDFGNVTFSKTDGANAPPPIKNNLSAGMGGVLDLPGLDLKAGMEMRHIMTSGYQLGQKLHFGTEISLPLLTLRLGSSQGYPTYGASFSFLFMDFDAAYYFTELGAYPGQTPENRILLGLSFSLSVDADFKFYSKDGKKRKLKQRR